ncbi:hypothetical protein ACLB2K_040553 [Fragaria x ananassa]
MGDAANLMSWGQFTALFRERYISHAHVNRMREEFLNLKKSDDIAVMAFEQRFRELSYYVLDLVKTDQEKSCPYNIQIKVSPTKVVVRFGKKGKLAPRYVGPFEILEIVGDLAYLLALPPIMSWVHNVFHVFLLRKYIPDASHVIDYSTIKVNADATFVVEPVRILDRSTKRLRRKEVELVKVCWSHHDEGYVSWELESDMRAKYPKLFLG